jgi:hypothetical protein
VAKVELQSPGARIATGTVLPSERLHRAPVGISRSAPNHFSVVATSICHVNGNVKMSGWPVVKLGKPPLKIPWWCFLIRSFQKRLRYFVYNERSRRGWTLRYLKDQPWRYEIGCRRARRTRTGMFARKFSSRHNRKGHHLTASVSQLPREVMGP